MSENSKRMPEARRGRAPEPAKERARLMKSSLLLVRSLSTLFTGSIMNWSFCTHACVCPSPLSAHCNTERKQNLHKS